MKTQVACFTVILSLVSWPARAQTAGDADAGATDAQTGANSDADDSAVGSDSGDSEDAPSDDGEVPLEAGPDALVDNADATSAESDGSGDAAGAESDSSADDSGADASSTKGASEDGASEDGGNDAGSDAARAGPPPPPIHEFDNANPGCSFGGAPAPGVAGLTGSALAALVLVRRRRTRA